MDYKKIINTKLGGVIKKSPEDFIVEEVHDWGICTINKGFLDSFKSSFKNKKSNKNEDNKFTHFTMIKKNASTFQAINTIARKLQISRKRFGVCGNKDKIAITSQRVSAYGCTPKDFRGIKFTNIFIKDVVPENHRLFPGQLEGNRFTLTIRDIPMSKKEIQTKLEQFSSKVKLGIPNYFGIQRFGDKREINHLVGEEMVNGHYEKAVKILLTATGDESEEATRARNNLKNNWGAWRQALKEFPKELDIEIKVLNSIVTGKSYQVALSHLPFQIRDIFVHAYQSYLFNKKLDNMVKNGLVSKTIVLSPIKTRDIKERGYERETLMFLKDFEILKVEKGLAKIRFTLKKGCYATVLLEELIN